MKPCFVCKKGFLIGESSPLLGDADGLLPVRLMEDHTLQVWQRVWPWQQNGVKCFQQQWTQSSFLDRTIKKNPKQKKKTNPVNQPETICWQFCKTPLGLVWHHAAPSWNPYAWQERGWELMSCSSSPCSCWFKQHPVAFTFLETSQGGE